MSKKNPKKQQDEQLTARGCLGLGLIAVSPGVLFYIAVMYEIRWLMFGVVLPLIGLVLLLALGIILTQHSGELNRYGRGLKTGCNALFLLIGIGILFDMFFGRDK